MLNDRHGLMARPKSGISDAISLALGIATVVLSVASAAMMASPNESTGGASCATAGDDISYSDYNSFKYALAANIVSAALQAVATLLTVRGHKNDGKVAKSLAELVDMASQVFLYSSSGLSLAVDDFGKCRVGGRRVGGVCKCSGMFCQWVRSSGAVSLAAGVALSLSQYVKDVPITVSFVEDEQEAKPGCGRNCHCHR